MNGPAVMSMNLVLAFFVNVPIALNATVPPVGTLPGSMVVLVAAGRGVNVGVGIFGVLVGVGFLPSRRRCRRGECRRGRGAGRDSDRFEREAG